MTAKNREETVVNFLKGTKWENAKRKNQSADCSCRRYEYLSLPNETAILMDCPHSEPIGPFSDVAKILTNLGYTVPTIYKEDRDEQLALVEYLAGTDFDKLEGKSFEIAMHKGIDLLVDLHKRFDEKKLDVWLPDYRYSDQWYMFWDDLFPVWGMTEISKEQGGNFEERFDYPPNKILKQWRDIWHELHNESDKSKTSLMLLDYHTPNLKYIPYKEGLKQVGLLDFQDAVIGPCAYDVVSLIEDARKTVEKPLQKDLLNHYIKDSNISDYQEFLKSFTIMSARRNLRNIGSWYRFKKAKNDTTHFECVKRHWFYLQESLQQPVLKDLYELVKPFTPEGFK
jgi:hypothetical protein